MIMDSLNFYQINLNKCKDAQANLMAELVSFKHKEFICLIQEPHFWGGLVPSSINRKSMQLFHAKGTKNNGPRAMIVASKGLKISLIESLTSRDITSINLHNSDGEIIVCSAYQDITFPEVINNIDKCVEHSKATNKELIIGSDSNAHSDLWMSESTNPRGEIFEDFITQSNLLVCNRGNKYTYDCALGKSIIDITLVTISLVDRIKDWKVHDEDYLTDHKLISFEFDYSKPAPTKSRNFKKANWSYFKSLLANKKWVKPKVWSRETITKEALKLTEDIKIALDKVCPEKEIKTTNMVEH